MSNSPFIVRNFPDHYSKRKKLLWNILTIIGRARIKPRKNRLTEKDYKNAKKILKKGDIVLVGTQRELSHLFIKTPFTHTLICYQKNRFIHSTTQGVVKTNLKDVVNRYDTLTILRLKNKKPEKIQNVINFTINQLGKPYNFEFKSQKDSYYCSELIYEALKQAGISLKLNEVEQITSMYMKITKINPIHPIQYINKQVDIVFQSHNINIDDNLNAKILKRNG